MSGTDLVQSAEITYSLTNGNSGKTKLRFGTAVALECYYGKPFKDLEDELQSAKGIAYMLWVQLRPQDDHSDEEEFIKFYKTIDIVSFELPDVEEEGDADPKVTPPTTSTDFSTEASQVE